MNTKTITVETDWLSEVDGLTVAKAIEYLQTLNPSYRLNCFMDGDTHGCQIVADLYYEVPLTEQEMYDKIEKRLLKEIKLYEDARVLHLQYNRLERAANCDRLLLQLNEKLSAAKVKYCKGVT